MTSKPWDIRNEGRAWMGENEGIERLELAPEKIELVRGKLFSNDRQRLTMLALLLENMGADAAVRLGDPDTWRQAIARLDGEATSS